MSKLIAETGGRHNFRRILKMIGGEEQQEDELRKLTGQVVEKFIKGISEYGMVSVFHDKETGIFTTALFSVFFSSPKIPLLYISMWKRDNKPNVEMLEAQRRFFGVVDNQLSLGANEHKPSRTNRAISVQHTWDMNEGVYELVYLRNAQIEATNVPIPRPIKEKSNFLKEILATQVNLRAIEHRFGRPYQKGDTWSNSTKPDTQIHNAYWVRDIQNQTPILMNNSIVK